MDSKKIKIILFVAIVFSLLTRAGVYLYAQTAALTAYEIIEKMDKRENGDTRIFDTTMLLIDKNNQQRIRKIKNISKDFGDDTKTIIFFLTPADVKNTAYMSFDWQESSKEDDSWLYLPALKKVKRIASADKSGSFMGSDFTYSDINGIEINDWDFSFVGENDRSDDADTWVIQGVPKKETQQKVTDETGYLRLLLWIQKDNYMLVKAKYWVRQGRKIKYFAAADIRKTDGIWTAYEMKMITTVKGEVEHSSLLKFSNVQYNTPVDDTSFTTRNMERGL